MEEYHSIPKELDNDNGKPSSFFLFSENSNSSNSSNYRFISEQFDNKYIFQYDDSQNNIDIFNNQAIQEINNNIERNSQSNQENNNNNNQINPENNNINNNNNLNKRLIFGITKEKRPNQTIANTTTGFTTNNKNGNIQKIEKVEEKQKDVNNNKIEGTFHGLRDFRDIYLRNFFDNLLGFIDYLIDDCYKNNIISPIPLRLIKKEYLLLHNAEEQYNMLDKKAINVLKIDINKVIKGGKEKEVESYNQKLSAIYKGENDQKDKITSVLNKKIGYLMNIYLGEVIPEEDDYQHFVRFEEYLSNLKKDNDYKEKLKFVAEVQFRERLNIILFKNSNKRGRKAQIKKNV